MDVNKAFLNDELTEDIYMKQSPGFEICGSNGILLAFRLNKVIYGLKQAPRAWFEKFRGFIIESLHFQISKADSSLLFKHIVSENVHSCVCG